MGRKDKAIPTNGDEPSIGLQLRQARQKRQLTLSAMALKLEYSKGHISGVETGHVIPSTEFIARYLYELKQIAEGSDLSITFDDTAVVTQKRARVTPIRSTRTKNGELITVPHDQVWPTNPSFLGRDTELQELRENVAVESKKIITMITGLAGVGKTNLWMQLSQSVKDSFDVILWWAYQQDAVIEDVLTKLDEYFGSAAAVGHDPLKRLVDYLTHHRCLLIIDGFDVAPTVSDEHNLLKTLFPALLKDGALSRLLVTMRYRPKIVPAEGNQGEVAWLTLQGFDAKQ